jgi:hypothetical protein
MQDRVTDNERFFLYMQLFQPAGVINTAALLTLTGAVDVAAMRHALDAVIRDNAALRTTFVMTAANGGTPDFTRRVHGAAPAPFSVEQIPDGTDAIAYVSREKTAEKKRRFDILNGPLFSVRLLLSGSDTNYMLLTFHHVIVDSYAQNVFIEELAAHYSAIRAGRPSRSQEKPVDFDDFLVWYTAETNREGRAEEADRFWGRYLQGHAPIALRRDRAAPPPSPFSFDTHWVRLEIDVGEDYAAFARSRRIGPSVPPFAAFALLLRGRSQSDALSLLNVTSGRDNPDHARIIGMLAGSTFVRSRVSAGTALSDFMADIQGDLLDAMDYGALSLADSMRGLIGSGIVTPTFLADPTIPKPLYNFLDHSDALGTSLFDGLHFTFAQDPEGDPGAQEISLMVRARPTGLTAWLGCWTHYYDPETIAAMARDFEAHFRTIVRNPETRIGDLLLAGA